MIKAPRELTSCTFERFVYLEKKKGADKSDSIDFVPPAHGGLTCDPTPFLQSQNPKEIIFMTWFIHFIEKTKTISSLMK